MAREWIIEDDYNIASDQNLLWSNKWNQTPDVAANELIILDLAQTVAQNIGKDNTGSINIHACCKIVC